MTVPPNLGAVPGRRRAAAALLQDRRVQAVAPDRAALHPPPSRRPSRSLAVASQRYPLPRKNPGDQLSQH